MTAVNGQTYWERVSIGWSPAAIFARSCFSRVRLMKGWRRRNRKRRLKPSYFHRRNNWEFKGHLRLSEFPDCNHIMLTVSAWWDTYLVQAELASGSLVEDVQAVGGLMQLGVTVPDLTHHFLYVLCQIRNLIYYLEITESHRIMSEGHKKSSTICFLWMVDCDPVDSPAASPRSVHPGLCSARWSSSSGHRLCCGADAPGHFFARIVRHISEVMRD